MNFATTLGVVATIVTIAVGVGTAVLFLVKQDRRTAYRVLAVTTGTVLIIVIVVAVFASAQPGGLAIGAPGQSGNDTNRPSSTATTGQPTPTPTFIPPTATKAPPAPYVLCRAGGKYGWQGWNIGGSWKLLNGVLLNDGTSSTSNYSPNLIPPPSCQPPTADYLVELNVQLNQQGGGNFGMNVRGQYVGVVGVMNYGGAVHFDVTDLNGDFYNMSQGDPTTVGTNSHTYAVKVQGNSVAILLDGGTQIQLTDNKYLDPGQIGLWSSQQQLQVNSFKVTILP